MTDAVRATTLGSRRPHRAMVRVGWRRIGALYLDLLLVSGALAIVLHLLGLEAYRWPISLAVVVCLEAFVWHRIRGSFGHFAMGLVRDAGGEWCVDPSLSPPTHWLLLLLGMIHFSNAYRLYVDGLLNEYAYHFVGWRVGGPAAKVVLVVAALGFVASAIALFRRPAYGPVVALGVPALVLLNDFLSLPLLPDTMRAAMTRAQARHGGRTLPLDAEQWAGLLLEVQVLHLVVLLVVLAVLRRYFPSRRAASA